MVNNYIIENFIKVTNFQRLIIYYQFQNLIMINFLIVSSKNLIFEFNQYLKIECCCILIYFIFIYFNYASNYVIEGH